MVVDKTVHSSVCLGGSRELITQTTSSREVGLPEMCFVTVSLCHLHCIAKNSSDFILKLDSFHCLTSVRFNSNCVRTPSLRVLNWAKKRQMPKPNHNHPQPPLHANLFESRFHSSVVFLQLCDTVIYAAFIIVLATDLKL